MLSHVGLESGHIPSSLSAEERTKNGLIKTDSRFQNYIHKPRPIETLKFMETQQRNEMTVIYSTATIV